MIVQKNCYKEAVKSIETFNLKVWPKYLIIKKLHNTNKLKLLESCHCKTMKCFEPSTAQCAVQMQKSRMTAIDGKPYL